MVRSAVTLLAPLPLLAVLSCTGPRQAGNEAAVSPPVRKETAVAAGAGSTKPAASTVEGQAPASPAPGRVTRIMLGDLFTLQQENRALIFDVRPAFLYRLGHIPGAVNWPKANFNSQIGPNEALIAGAKAAGKPVIVYCVDFACPDGRTVATWLSARGHSVAVLEGGWDAWKTGGLPAE